MSPPISGGTLLVLRSGHRVVVSDPDRARLIVVDLDETDSPVVATLQLPLDSEPGRLVEDASGRVHVLLRGAGEMASFTPSEAEPALSRRAVCAMPRGIAVSGSGLHVACRGGALVTFGSDGPEPTRRVQLERDLRDIVAVGDHLHITRFRSAEVLVVDAAAGTVSSRTPTSVLEGFSSRVAWRTRPFADGVAVLHQQEKDEPVQVSASGYGSAFGGVSCRGIVRTSLSFVGTAERPALVEIPSAPLPVDFDVRRSADGQLVEVALVAAGRQNGERSVIRLDATAVEAGGCQPGTSLSNAASIQNPIAIAFASNRLVVQQRDPSQLVVMGADGVLERSIELGGGSAFDTGHSIFHVATAASIACASCHPEGGDDGHTWTFSDVGARRTPALHSVAGTAPFHWSGDIPNMRTLVNEVFVRRMSGSRLDATRVEALEAWIDHIPAPRSSSADTAAIRRGRAVFRGAGRCARCHSGPNFTNGESEDIGRGESLQVPSLIGVAHRLPVMHDGCASTLRARFEPACGGDEHGGTVRGSALDDLIVFLESL